MLWDVMRGGSWKELREHTFLCHFKGLFLLSLLSNVSGVFVFTGSCGRRRTLRKTHREQLWELTSGGNISSLRFVGTTVNNFCVPVWIFVQTENNACCSKHRLCSGGILFPTCMWHIICQHYRMFWLKKHFLEWVRIIHQVKVLNRFICKTRCSSLGWLILIGCGSHLELRWLQMLINLYIQFILKSLIKIHLLVYEIIY